MLLSTNKEQTFETKIKEDVTGDEDLDQTKDTVSRDDSSTALGAKKNQILETPAMAADNALNQINITESKDQSPGANKDLLMRLKRESQKDIDPKTNENKNCDENENKIHNDNEKKHKNENKNNNKNDENKNNHEKNDEDEDKHGNDNDNKRNENANDIESYQDDNYEKSGESNDNDKEECQEENYSEINENVSIENKESTETGKQSATTESTTGNASNEENAHKIDTCTRMIDKTKMDNNVDQEEELCDDLNDYHKEAEEMFQQKNVEDDTDDHEETCENEENAEPSNNDILEEGLDEICEDTEGELMPHEIKQLPMHAQSKLIFGGDKFLNATTKKSPRYMTSQVTIDINWERIIYKRQQNVMKTNQNGTKIPHKCKILKVCKNRTKIPHKCKILKACKNGTIKNQKRRKNGNLNNGNLKIFWKFNIWKFID